MDQVHRTQAVPLLKAIEDTLKSNEAIKLPENHDLIKTGFGRQYSPDSTCWFYMRMAAIVRQAMRNGTVSLKGLAYKHGNRKNRGVRPSCFAKGSNFVNGSAIAQLESIGWINFANKKDILTETAKEVLSDIMEKINQQ